jgi:hypothetical protein
VQAEVRDCLNKKRRLREVVVTWWMAEVDGRVIGQVFTFNTFLNLFAICTLLTIICSTNCVEVVCDSSIDRNR